MEQPAADGGFLYERVASEVRGLIDAGVLAPGDRAPSLRRMSRQARVSIATVMQAYMALERKGYLEARPKSGFYVRARRPVEPSVPRPSSPRSAPRKVQFGDLVHTIFAVNRKPGMISLGVANPSPELLPVKALIRATSQIANRHPLAALEYCFQPGAEELRRQVALRAAALGCVVEPDEVIVTAGATEALAVSLQAVARAGDAIAVESPCYFIVLQLIERLGMLAVEIRTDPDEGISLEALERTLAEVDVRAVLLVPSFNNPLGSLVPQANRARLVELLGARGIPLIEDDIYGDLHFGDERPPLAKRFDERGLVLTCSSFSKTLAPGYRVGWVLPGRYRQAVMQWKQMTSPATASLPQLALAEFLHTGNYDRFLRRVRRTYREQVERMRLAIGEAFPPGTRVTRPQGGFVLWVELPKAVDGEALFRAALERGVSVAPGVLFSPTRRYRNFVRIACGLPWSEAIEGAIATLGELSHRLAAGARRHSEARSAAD